MMLTISHRVRTDIRSIIVAEAGKRQNKKNTKSMKTEPQKRTIADVINSAIPSPAVKAVRRELIHRLEDAHEDVAKQMERILCSLSRRTAKILRPLGIELVRLRAELRPIGSVPRLAERLSQIEIVPKVRRTPLRAEGKRDLS